MEYLTHSPTGHECIGGKETDVMIKTVFQAITGLLMTATAIIFALAFIAVFTGITTHNLLSMLALAGTLALTAAGLQWLLQSVPQCDEERPENTVPIDQGAAANKKQSVLFDPWTDEWYGSGPWWKKW